ncbi:hypothetical protein GTH32_05515 [Alteromonas sp. 345S023]|uniref:DUF3566 domain-containing protein n=1 Tax=Alteromonas profundi TaxID=2696062 RepID=A0A7X5LKZ6_9ALTE|nr:hypothetical protein [Alteromonas profundi]NDV90655.1 hypothetical protein [Alteromonas profundi]
MAKRNRLAVHPFAKFQAFLFGLVGALLGFIYAIGGLALDILISVGILGSLPGVSSGLGLGSSMAFGAILGIPLILMLAGYVIGTIEAHAYNVFVKFSTSLNTDFWD